MSVLDTIVAQKRLDVAAAKERRAESSVRDAAAAMPATRNFFHMLAQPGPIKLIAEVKKASPSAGLIRADFDPVAIARTYERHGATCLSVLTDEHFFQGRLDYLTNVRAAVGIPVLRKDFIIDKYQLYEARAAGADAVLLIAECLNDCDLRSLHNEAVALGLTPLVELYDEANLPRVFDAGATLIGVNNRDLRTMVTDLDHCLRLRDKIPDQCVYVAESGIKTHADVERLTAAGVDAILVGESLMRQPDIGAAVDALLGGI
ncbi:MAG: indole-3-glycerol phosphate synthase TrpC [Pirellulales bacterium]